MRIRGDQLRARDGRYELRVTNELEEALFVDRLQLVAIEHPPAVEVHPSEGLVRAAVSAASSSTSLRDVRPAGARVRCTPAATSPRALRAAIACSSTTCRSSRSAATRGRTR